MIFISRGFDLFIACLVSSVHVCVMVIVYINKTEKPGCFYLTQMLAELGLIIVHFRSGGRTLGFHGIIGLMRQFKN